MEKLIFNKPMHLSMSMLVTCSTVWLRIRVRGHSDTAQGGPSVVWPGTADSRTLPQTHSDLQHFYCCTCGQTRQTSDCFDAFDRYFQSDGLRWTVNVEIKTIRNHAIFVSCFIFPRFHTSPLLPCDKVWSPAPGDKESEDPRTAMKERSFAKFSHSPQVDLNLWR